MPIRSFLLLASLVLGACAHHPSYAPADPLETMNRGIYSFNSTADEFVLRPIAVGYKKAIPAFARTGINNFFSNLAAPTTIINQYLQGKFATGTADFGRFLINSTFGLGGLLDVASHWGLPQHREDFGQTFGRWGAGEGWYIMLPLLGPSTSRDLFGRALEVPINPSFHVEERPEISWGLSILDAIQIRAQLLNADALLRNQLDPYVFVRSAYLQKRWSDIHDGNAPSEEPDFEEFDDF